MFLFYSDWGHNNIINEHCVLFIKALLTILSITEVTDLKSERPFSLHLSTIRGVALCWPGAKKNPGLRHCKEPLLFCAVNNGHRVSFQAFTWLKICFLQYNDPFKVQGLGHHCF